MASDFDRATGDGKAVAANTPFTVHTSIPAGAADLGLGCICTNVTDQDGAPKQITISLWIELNGGGTIYILNATPIPAGNAIPVAVGKLVMTSGDVLKAQADEANALDVHYSYLRDNN